jgi:micrococcal nuclease
MELISIVLGVIILAVVAWLVLHLIGSILKASMIIVLLILMAYFVFGFSFGLAGVWDFATGHTDVSKEGIMFKFTDDTETGTVASVTDGDTLVLADGSKVRLLGINTPETGEQCASEAKLALEELTLDKEVKLQLDNEDLDAYGRKLRYVWVDSTTFVNLNLVSDGVAIAYDYNGDGKYATAFKAAEKKAQLTNTCLWKSSEYKNCLTISDFNYDAEGNDNNNLNDEYIVFENSCESLDMTGWTLQDESASNRYTFSTFVAPEEFTVFSGTGDKTETEIYLGRTQGIWNNDGDTLFIRDTLGDLALVENYEV